MVRQDVFGHIKPELGHLCQNGTFLCNLVVQDHIKTADAVRSNHDKAVAIIINLAYFTFFDRL